MAIKLIYYEVNEMNPFNEKGIKLQDAICPINEMCYKPYDKNTVDPFTKTRIILMNGTEFEQNWFMHNLHRHVDNNDLRRDVAYLRRMEQQQQKRIASLKPNNESILETTIGYEQLAVDLTAALAENVTDRYVKATLDFALLEDFDHLYRYSDLLDFDEGIKAESIVGGYTELMPARPTTAHHRHPLDEVRRHINDKKADPFTKLCVNIITAAEQQTMNYYMNVGQFYKNDYGRALYSEIAMVEEAHVTEYGSLIDPNCTWLEGLLMHEYVECYLYYSCYKDETSDYMKKVWQELYEEEVGHLHYAAELLKKYEKKEAEMVIPDGAFPNLLTFHSNIDYVRTILANTVENTASCEDYVNINEVPDDALFFQYQSAAVPKADMLASHTTMKMYIDKNGEDYRFETKENPIECLRDRKSDNYTLGRVKSK